MNENSETLSTLALLLQEISNIAEDSAMTGQLRSGQRRLVDRYNWILGQVTASKLVPAGMFTPLGAADTLEDVAIEARLLRLAFSTPKEARPSDMAAAMDPGHLVRLAPFLHSADLGKLVRAATASKTHLDADLIVSLAPFLDAESLGELVRDSLVGPKGVPSREPEVPEEPERPETSANEDREEARAPFRSGSHELSHVSTPIQTEEPAPESARER